MIKFDCLGMARNECIRLSGLEDNGSLQVKSYFDKGIRKNDNLIFRLSVQLKDIACPSLSVIQKKEFSLVCFKDTDNKVKTLILNRNI